VYRVLGILLAVALASCASTPAQPVEKLQVIEVDRLDSILRHARATLEIKSKAGVCLWTITGDGDLLRLPQKDERYSAVLLSAQFDNSDQVVVKLAGENAPLETIVLGEYTVPLHGDVAIAADSFFKDTKAGAWEMKIVPLETGVDPLCCTCDLQQVRCCPNAGWCLAGGTCGSCCNVVGSPPAQ
jgi:hypothetical protein